ncbi:hypothetical protein HIM_08569 [Hirsutella minnesotensis 3608]|uniref:Iron-sulfur assembly protein 1 n=1 Tax=Hirsutella minnesotensis 3608 TaxID=1043627 RepID=A0A0F7ZSV2_9HYPO|nr:hypothetical protein HIM_08569 [Hirsutella minnesotensis 3608]
MPKTNVEMPRIKGETAVGALGAWLTNSRHLVGSGDAGVAHSGHPTPGGPIFQRSKPDSRIPPTYCTSSPNNAPSVLSPWPDRSQQTSFPETSHAAQRVCALHDCKMNAFSLLARAAVRRHACRPSLMTLPTPRVAAAAYHSYSLPTSAPRGADLPETPIAQPEPLPRVHETRPPHTPPQQPAPQQTPATQQSPTQAAAPQTATDGAQTAKTRPARPRTKLRARKAAMKLTPSAVEQLRILLDQPEPKFIKVGVRNRGCSGLAYHLEYVDKPGAFDETVEQDGVKVLIDSKALFSIIGSEMDWAEDKLNQRFIFKNPNIKEQCGCGESFMV